MTTPDVDQALERLFSVGRAATAPDAGARERIRASLASRLVSGAPTTQPTWSRRAWLRLGVALVGVSVGALWLTRGPHANEITLPVAVPAPVTAPEAPGVEPAPSVAPTSPAPAEVIAPLASAKPAPTHNADPAEELPLVRAMQQALHSGNPSRALVLAADHARRFPRGTLVEEREGVRAVAQCQLAAPGARAGISDAFTHRFATSPYAARVKAACQ